MTLVVATHPLRAPALATLVRATGPVLVGVAVLASLASSPAGVTMPSWAPAVALAALVLGVPHGAVDHLALAPPSARRRRRVLGTAYLAAAALAAAVIVGAPAPAFLAVLAMSVWHFGSGDVELADELAGSPVRRRWRRATHVIAAGSVPVLLPLTAAEATPTLLALEPRLAAVTAPAALLAVRVVVLLLAAVTAVALLQERRAAAAGELALLVALALTATPLLAFAVYFAAWHAARHTLRLGLDPRGRLDPALLRRVVRDGLPALAVTLGVLAAVLLTGAGSAPAVLWLALAAVWGLTVPHMVVVGAFDRRRRLARQASRSQPGGGSDTSPVTACTSVSWRNVSQS